MPRISRVRLLNTLHGSLASCTSTIINGRAGTGKTMLATDFAHRSGRRVAWYKVDASDGDLRVFFQYLIESVRRERKRFGYEAFRDCSLKRARPKMCRCLPKLLFTS